MTKAEIVAQLRVFAGYRSPMVSVATAWFKQFADAIEALPDATPSECAAKYVSKEPPTADDIAWAEKVAATPSDSPRCCKRCGEALDEYCYDCGDAKATQ